MVGIPDSIPDNVLIDKIIILSILLILSKIP